MTARKSPIGRARGHGSAKEGASHWWQQFLTGIALVPLGFWFVASMLALTGKSQPEVAEWLAGRRHAVMMSLLVIAAFYHFKLGMQMIFEDYVENKVVKLWALVLTNYTCIALAFVCVFSVLKLAFGS